MKMNGREKLNMVLLYPLESSGGILWFRFATPPPDFLALTLSEKTTPARFTKFAGNLYWEVSFSGTEISLIV